MADLGFSRRGKVSDQYGNQYQLASELARGGQGVVYRTADPDLAIKQPLRADGEVDLTSDRQGTYQKVRWLPLPPRIPISLPKAVLRDEPGYVMRLLSDMEPFSTFELNGDTRIGMAHETIPKWLAGSKDKGAALTLLHYARSGSTKRRLLALGKAAAILARLHAAGLVYCDISPNNCFMSEGGSKDVWLIDTDNLRFERAEGGSSVFTPRYGAPEVVQGVDRSRPRSDCWAFAVMSFELLALVHPFIGEKVLFPDDTEGGWDAEPISDGAPDPDQRAFAGLLPFIDDEKDRSNRGVSGLPRALVLTSQLARLFQETFVPGCRDAWRRPAMAYWALELTRAHDQSIECHTCSMSHGIDHIKCPYCKAPRMKTAIATTDRWQMVIQADGTEVKLPHRLFNPFSLELNADTAFEAVLDFKGESATRVRGTDPLPTGLTFRFLKGSR